MSARNDDGSGPEHQQTSTRNTARDVPAAKFKEGSVGTVAPRGLRGPSLLPGQGAPERINPEEVELAVLRDAETLDGPHVARAAQKRLPDPRSPSPTPVSVEVPRVRSIPPAHAEYPSTPPSPSARSIQSGTLMSIGSVDPRAPTELSLPGPRPLSVSERAVYMGPEAVVDRTPSTPPRELPGVLESGRYLDATLRPGAPSPEPPPNSSARAVPSTSAIPSGRPSFKPDSVAPPAQKFVRPPHSYAPVSPRPESVRESRPEAASSRRPAPGSDADAPRQFQIHAQLDAVRYEPREDNFDLRSASTQREPLASRKRLPSSDWTPHGPASEASFRESSSGASASASASRYSIPADFETAPPTTDRIVPPPRASVPVSWVLGVAAFAVLLALIVAWFLRPPSTSPQDNAAARAIDGRSSASAPSQASQAAPEQAFQAQPGAARAPSKKEARPGGARSAPKAAAGRAAASASAEVAPKSVVPTPVPADSNDSNSKVHQSIY